MSLNGGYAMIKYNSTQEELQIAYRSKRPALFYDENNRAHWAIIEETATQSVDEETQEPITIYEYSYKLLNAVVANPTLSGDEATLNGLDVDGTKYKVGGGSEVHLYMHVLFMSYPNQYNLCLTIYNSKSEAYNYKSLTAENLGSVQITGSYENGTKVAIGGYIGYNEISYYGIDQSTGGVSNSGNFNDYITQIF